MAENLLLIIPDGPTYESMRETFESDYNIIHVTSPEEALEIISKRRREIKAVVLDICYIESHGTELPHQIAGDDPFTRLPVVGLTAGVLTAEAVSYLSYYVYDLLNPKASPIWNKRRIRNAIRGTESISLTNIEKLLQVLPANITLKDTESRYIFSTHQWSHLLHPEIPGWVHGKTELEVRKDKENAKKAMETDREVIETGKGMQYVVQEHSNGIIEYLQIVKRPVYDDAGKISGVISLISDVTEQELLKLELEQRAQVDKLTELLNKSTTEELIRIRLSTGLKNDRPGALLMMDVDNFKSVNDQFGHAIGDQVLSEIGRVIRNSFRGADVAGRVGGDEFMVYLQGVHSEDVALTLANRIEHHIQTIHDLPHVTTSIGMALFPEHGKTFEELYNAADNALYQVKRDGKAGCRVYKREE